MKRIISTVGNLFLVSTVLWGQTGQIGNNGFNVWSSDGYNPIGWTTVASALPNALAGTLYAAYATALQPGFALSATQDLSNKVEGSSALKLTTIATPSVAQSALGPTTPGVIGLGDLDIAAIEAGSNALLTGSAFSYKPDTILFQYKYEPVGTDTAILVLNFKNGGTDVAGGVIIKYLFSTNGAWVTDTTIITTWTNSPDNAVFQISSGWQQGSVLHVDALHFGYTTIPVAGPPTVSLSVSTNTVNAGDTAYFIATLNQPDTVAFMVDIYGGGTANYQTDFIPSDNIFFFEIGQTTDTIIIATTVTASERYITVALAEAMNNSYILGEITADTLFIKATPIGIKEIDIKSRIGLYPVPASEKVTIVIPAELPAQNINVTGINGKVVVTENNISGTNSISLANVASGNYLITFTDAVTKIYTAARQLQIVK